MDKPENMSHIYECEKLNSERITTKYENIYKDKIEKIRKVYERFEIYIQKRELIQNQMRKTEYSQETCVIGPSFSVPCIVSGNG